MTPDQERGRVERAEGRHVHNEARVPRKKKRAREISSAQQTRPFRLSPVLVRRRRRRRRPARVVSPVVDPEFRLSPFENQTQDQERPLQNPSHKVRRPTRKVDPGSDRERVYKHERSRCLTSRETCLSRAVLAEWTNENSLGSTSLGSTSFLRASSSPCGSAAVRTVRTRARRSGGPTSSPTLEPPAHSGVPFRSVVTNRLLLLLVSSRAHQEE